LNPYNSGKDPVYGYKPAYFAAYTFMHLLEGYSFQEVSLAQNNNYVFRFEKAVNQPTFVAWTSSNVNHTLEFALGSINPGQCFKAINYLGNSLGNICAKNRIVSLTVSEGPTYLVFG